MPQKSRTKRILEWLVTLFLSVASVLYLRNIKNALRSVTKNWREYICFYLAALVMTAGFWTVALCSEANMRAAEKAVAEEYDYHIEVAMLNNEQYANLDQVLQYEVKRENEYIESYYWQNGGEPLTDGTYTCRIVLDTTFGLQKAYEEVSANMLGRVTAERREIRLSPLYTFREDFGIPYGVQFWTVSLIWLAFSIFMMVVLFLIRLDHFRFIYGVYMTCGADFPKLMGAAGGELVTVTVLTWIPGLLVGILIAGALYIPQGVGLWFTVKGVLVPLLGGLIAVFASVWFPMRRMSAQPPVRHLQAGDNTGLVSSPRRSFFLFGETFPGKYELYGFWRMRKYYLRLLISAVLFAAFFVSGLYVAELKDDRNQMDPYEYLVAYRPAGYFDTYEDEEGLDISWTPDAEEAELIWGDLDVFLPELDAIEGISHAEWKTAVSGGHTLSHLLLTPGQLFESSRYTVSSTERQSEGFKWAVNNYEYTAVDETWIRNALEHGLCEFEGDPYSVLTTRNGVIISEDIYNKKTYDFKPGDKIVVAVYESVRMPIRTVTDPKELLRKQIECYNFRYETYTVCAVAHGMSSESRITLGVTYDNFTALTGAAPARTELKVYVEAGTDMDTVTAAEDQIRRLLLPFSHWVVKPTGNYFDFSVKSLKNDSAVILTLAVCLLLISPMVWYFSQIMFYRKRRNEFAVLHALGAPDQSFAKLHRLAGGVLSGAAFLMTVLLTLLCNYLIYYAVSTLLPWLHIIESVYSEFRLSVPALIACVVVSVLCGFLSCELPYRMFTKKDIGVRRVD